MNDVSDVLFLMAAMVLFSVMVMNSNRLFIRNATMQVESEIEFSAIAIAQSIIDEARTKAFDVVTVGGGGDLGDSEAIAGGVPDGFTAPADLGPEAGEVYPNFNDFDDFHGLALVRTTGYGDFQIQAEVFYVNPINPTTNIGARSISKRLVVVVNHDTLPNSVTLSYVRTFF